MNSKVKYWAEISDYDLKTADAMLKSRRFIYVGFMCHQSIEKILKAYFTYKLNENPPYTHNLTKLSEISGLVKFLSIEQKKFLSLLQPLNIEARYPKYKSSIFKSLTKSKCILILDNTKNIQKWVKKKLI